MIQKAIKLANHTRHGEWDNLPITTSEIIAFVNVADAFNKAFSGDWKPKAMFEAFKITIANHYDKDEASALIEKAKDLGLL